MECLPCQKKYTHFSFPRALTCCSPFCLLPTAKQKAHAEKSTLAIGLNSTWFNLICQLSTSPSRTGKIKCPTGRTLGLQASNVPQVGIVSSGGCKPTERDACVGQRKRCRKNWYYLEENNWHHLSQFACEMVHPVMLPEECIMAHFPHYTLFFGSRRVAGWNNTGNSNSWESYRHKRKVFLGKVILERKTTEQKNTKAVFCSHKKVRIR